MGMWKMNSPASYASHTELYPQGKHAPSFDSTGFQISSKAPEEVVVALIAFGYNRTCCHLDGALSF